MYRDRFVLDHRSCSGPFSKAVSIQTKCAMYLVCDISRESFSIAGYDVTRGLNFAPNPTSRVTSTKLLSHAPHRDKQGIGYFFIAESPRKTIANEGMRALFQPRVLPTIEEQDNPFRRA
jgi:hypothetical protein